MRETRRVLTNVAELMAAVRDATGNAARIEMLFLTGRPLEEQVRLVREADVTVQVWGSSMPLQIVMRPETCTVQLCPFLMLSGAAMFLPFELAAGLSPNCTKHIVVNRPKEDGVGKLRDPKLERTRLRRLSDANVTLTPEEMDAAVALVENAVAFRLARRRRDAAADGGASS